MSDPARPREERLAAAVPLIALGRDEPSMSLLREAATSDPAERQRLYAALPWLAWENRLALFNELVAKDSSDESLSMLIPAMSALADRRAAEPLWQMLAKEGISIPTTATIFNAFSNIYFEGHSYDAATAPIADKPAIAKEFKTKALAGGSDMTRLVAIAMLASLAPDDGVEVSATILADASTPPGVRADALQLRLMVLDTSAGQSLAVEMIGSPDLATRKVALAYLSGDMSRIRSLRGAINLYIQNRSLDSVNNEYNASDAIVLLPPAKLQPEPLRALLRDPDRECAASAAYLLALLGERDGLPILIEQWRIKMNENENWRRLAYRAISAIDDDSLTPVLEEIYQSMSTEQSYLVRSFYWTVRNVHGPNALKLRKRIRDDIGMAQLK